MVDILLIVAGILLIVMVRQKKKQGAKLTTLDKVAFVVGILCILNGCLLFLHGYFIGYGKARGIIPKEFITIQ